MLIKYTILLKMFCRYLTLGIILLIYETGSTNGIIRGKLKVPLTYTAMSSDLHVQLHTITSSIVANNDLRLQITKLNNDSTRKVIGSVDIYSDSMMNITNITIPCAHFIWGGLYELEVIGNEINSSLEVHNEKLSHILDVRWPIPKLSLTPDSIGTYPQEPVDVRLEFLDVECSVPNMNDLTDIPEFWLELLFCGHDVFCDSSNVTKSQILYDRQIRGFPKAISIKLNCELFGLAGHYVLKLKPVSPALSVISTSAYIKADWNEQYVFNVHARSIIPCDTHSGGIGVLFEYPACILDQADRIRLFGKLRADVASLAPPTTLHYITEQRVKRGQHSLYFDCELFSEKYVEYCFVYVSQAISGAVADIRMDCVATHSASDFDSGGWGPWSDWTPCSTTCVGGTRNRYRFCDSPPPKYGAKFCEGLAVETEKCGGPVTGTWECLYGSGNSITGEVPADRPEVIAEIGPACHCGCIVHLGVVKPKRLVASSAQSCPGRTFWLIQADPDYRIRFKIDFFRLPCVSQSLKVRDGDSLSSDMIAEYNGGTEHANTVTSTGFQILIEFFSNELESIGETCGGGFLAHVQQIQQLQTNVSTIFVPSKAIMSISSNDNGNALKLTITHLVAILFVSLILVISTLLGVQYVFRYRKYQLAESKGEPDSPARTPTESINLDQNVNEEVPSRAISTTTLISEVISLVKIRSRSGRLKHSRLQESVYLENEGNDDSNKSFSNDNIGSAYSLTNSAVQDIDMSPKSNVTESEPSHSSPSDNSASIATITNYTPVISKKFNHKTKIMTTCTNQEDVALNEISKISLNNKEVESNSFIKPLSVDNKKLTNVRGCYSPALSLASIATIRTTNPKENKEKQNRKKLLAGPGSEFSLANQEDMELDYYDYNVINAGAAPGSYLGMDPAFLVWIPPLDNNPENEQDPQYAEILPTHEIDPGSNTETPEEELPQMPIKPPRKSLTTNDCVKQFVNENLNYKDDNMKVDTEKSSSSNTTCNLYTKINSTTENIQLQEFSKALYQHSIKSAIKIHKEIEKETTVVKSPSDNKITEYYELSDIQYADEDEDISLSNKELVTESINENEEMLGYSNKNVV